MCRSVQAGRDLQEAKGELPLQLGHYTEIDREWAAYGGIPEICEVLTRYGINSTLRVASPVD